MRHLHSVFKSTDHLTADPSELPEGAAEALFHQEAMTSDEVNAHCLSSVSSLGEIADDLRPLSDIAITAAPQSVRGVLRAMSDSGAHPALMYHQLFALNWHDLDVVRHQLSGFPLVGDIPVDPRAKVETIRRAERTADALIAEAPRHRLAAIRRASQPLSLIHISEPTRPY